MKPNRSLVTPHQATAIVVNTIITVSYTHLDVYKRQVPARAQRG